MSSGIERITRRRFLVLLAGLLGVGTAAWRIDRDAAPASLGQTPPPISQLPPVSGTAAVTTTTAAADAPAVPVGATRTIDVLCREAWGAQPIAGQLTPHVPVRMTVHHTAALLTDHAAAPSYVRDHQRFHQADRGWPDVAYHFIIDDAGIIYEGRPVDAVGDTATRYDPTGHFLVACEGDFGRQAVPDAQYASLIDVLAWAAATLDIDPATITGHRDWASTACPGDALYAPIADGSLARLVMARTDEGAVELRRQCGPEATEVVAAIERGTPPDPLPSPDRGHGAE